MNHNNKTYHSLGELVHNFLYLSWEEEFNYNGEEWIFKGDGADRVGLFSIIQHKETREEFRVHKTHLHHKNIHK